MRYCGFWPPSTSLDFPEAFTCFSADDLVEHLRSEKQILTSDVVFIEPDPSYWEKALTPDTKQFLRSAIIEGHSTKGEEVTDEQIVSVCGKGLFPDLNKYSDPLGLEDVLREWLLKKVFGDLYSGS